MLSTAEPTNRGAVGMEISVTTKALPTPLWPYRYLPEANRAFSPLIDVVTICLGEAGAEISTVEIVLSPSLPTYAYLPET